jgi:uncharacterized membrane protein YccC
MAQQTETASSAGPQELPRPGHRAGRPGLPDWRVTWSAPAAMRAVRATIVVPCLFALTFKVIGDPQMTVFAVFGAFGALVMTSFGGGRRDKAIAHLGLALTGSAALVIGTLVSGSAWLAAIVTVPVAFAIFFAGVAGPNAASGVTAALLAYVLPVASTATASTIPSRLEGWWLASAVSTAAVLLMSPRSPGDRLRASAAATATALARHLQAALLGTATPADREASIAAKHELMSLFSATPYRPIGLAAADQGLAGVINLLEWCTSLICDAVDGHLDLRGAAAEDRDLLTVSAAALRDVAALLSGQDASPDLERVWRARSASAAHLRSLTGDPATVLRQADRAFHAQTIGVAASAAAGDAMIAARRADPDFIAAQRRRWLDGRDDDGLAESRPTWHRLLARTAGIVIATDASIRSPWFRNSARGAVALAAAVAVAKLTDVEHAFWVVLGTLSVLRTSASATGATAMRALAGTAAGFIVGAGLLIAIGTNPVALWVAFPLAVLVAAYAPGTAPFIVGQAAFTITVVVLFNLLAPAGWQVGLLRVEDVAIGCAVSIVVGVLFWPRGAASVVGDNLADAFRCGADYLTDAASWALGASEERPGRAVAATGAGRRLDDALRGYLTEQGSKRLAKDDLWTLAMASLRLRLTAHSLASLPPAPTAAAAPVHGEAARATLGQQAAELAAFYVRIAAQVARPEHGASAPADVAVPAGLAGQPDGPCTEGPPHYHPEALWVRDHLRHLESHAASITGPATRLAWLRRTPWWRSPGRR